MDNFAWVLDGLRHVKPELALVVAILGVILVDLTRFKKGAPLFAILGLVAAGWLVGRLAYPHGSGGQILPPIQHVAFKGAYAIDGFASYFKLAFLTAALIVAVF